MKYGILGGAILFLCAVSSAIAEDAKTLIIYDSSNSMWAEMSDGSRRYEAGRSALSQALGADLGQQKIGLRAYGHRRKQDCTDTELLVPFAEASGVAPTIRDAVSSIRPTGKTPITRSLTAGLKDLGGAGNILLITDGIETCDADPCALMKAWADDGVDVKVHVVGIGLSKKERDALQCISDPSDGLFLDANSIDEFKNALGKATKQIATNAPETNTGTPIDTPDLVRFTLRGIGRDGEIYRMGGKISLPSGEESLATGGAFNSVPEPGEYKINAGIIGPGGLIISPKDYTITVEDAFSGIIEVPVEDPARVQALFVLNEQEVDGSLVSANQEGRKVFGLLPFDTVLAPAGDYQFTASPNDDNELTITATLTAGEKTIVRFEMTETIDVQVKLVYPDGSVFKPRKNPELWKDGAKAYTVPPGRDLTMLAGIYELRLNDPLSPLAIAGLEIRKDGDFPVEVRLGFAEIELAESDYFLRKPDRAFIAPVGTRRRNVSLGIPVPLLPGRYQLTGLENHGYFNPKFFDIAAGETTSLTLTPLPVGSLIVNYAAGEYAAKPDRAFARRIDGDIPKDKTFLNAGQEIRLPEGQYEITPRSQLQNVDPVIVVISKDQPAKVELKPN